RVAGVVERAFNGYLTLVQGNRPETLPRLAWRGADAVALVSADLVLVVGIEHFIGEGEDIAGAVALRARVGNRVGGGVLDHLDLLGCGRAGNEGDGGNRGDQHQVQARQRLQRIRHDNLPELDLEPAASLPPVD